MLCTTALHDVHTSISKLYQLFHFKIVDSGEEMGKQKQTRGKQESEEEEKRKEEEIKASISLPITAHAL